MYILTYTISYTIKQNIHSINIGGYSLYSHLEDYIYELYTTIGVKKPKDLDMYTIAKKLGVKVTYEENINFYFDNEIYLKKGTKKQEWVDFAHELCHKLRHAGVQLNMHRLFIDLQEYQANYFTYHFCVPTFMLDQLKEVSVYEIMNQFNVEYDFAVRRLEMYKNKFYGVINYERVTY